MKAVLNGILALLLAAGTVRAQTHLIVISGLSGEPKYAALFHEWSVKMIDAAQRRWGVPSSRITYLAEKNERDPQRIAYRSTRENIEQVFRDVAAKAAPDDQLFVLLIGHGATRDGQATLNLPGPDMTAADFSRLLQGFPTQKIVFVNASSASGDFIPVLSGENRAIITATRSGNERNETIFAGHFVEAFAGEGADTDKDQRISALEAFVYARREVERTYEADGSLLTEHALLDDDGDGEGRGDPGAGKPDGVLAQVLFLAGSSTQLGIAELPSDPRLAGLYRQRQALEQEVAALRQRKETMDRSIYEQELERLLVALALKTREIRESDRKDE
jgi:hypothetical protein